jgi:hypothetical protein
MSMPDRVDFSLSRRKLILIVGDDSEVQRLHALDFAATTYSVDVDIERFRSADAMLVPADDDAGYAHVNQVGLALSGIAARIRVLRLPDLPPSGNITHWLAFGGTREQLDALIDEAPEWVPPEDGKAAATDAEQKLIDELARLGAIQYDRRRNDAAQELGVRAERWTGKSEPDVRNS